MARLALVMTGPLTVLTLTAAPAPAQAAGPPAPRESAVQLRLGIFMPAGDSDFWDDTGDVFTLDISDFDDFTAGFSYVHPSSNHVEIGVNFDLYGGNSSSVYRDFVDEDGFTIPHDTDLSLLPLTVDVRLIPGGRYRVRPGGRYVLKPVFYIGAGLGVTFWEYEEEGFFLDFTDYPEDPPVVFYDRFVDDGAAFEVHALAGVEIPIGRRTNLLFEGRFSVSEDDLGGDFAGLPATELDLSGTSIAGGLSFRF